MVNKPLINLNKALFLRGGSFGEGKKIVTRWAPTSYKYLDVPLEVRIKA